MCFGKRLRGGTPTFNPEKARGHPLPSSSFRAAFLEKVNVFPGRKSSWRVFTGFDRFSSLFLRGEPRFLFLSRGNRAAFPPIPGTIVSQKFEGGAGCARIESGV